ncbi:MAG: tRNA lysidine(34) synthetase TilS [bacterium]
MDKKFAGFISDSRLFEGDQLVLLAVSGGIDSTVMAHLFHSAGFRFGIAHCNFTLRGNDSDEDAAFVKRMGLQFRVPYFSQTFDTRKTAAEKGISIQMAARELRYNWFERTREENRFDFIATAHHLDDQAETFLINLLRGTGIAGLHGIPVKNGHVIRPMMFAFRNDIEKYARKRQIDFRTDKSNDERKYLRNKIRHELIPVFSSINPDFSRGLAGTIAKLREFETIGNSAMQQWCNAAMTQKGENVVVGLSHFSGLAAAESYAWNLLSPYGFSETQVSNLLYSLNTSGTRSFRSATHIMVRNRKDLVISEIKQQAKEKDVSIELFRLKKKIRKPIPLSFERIGDVGNYIIPTDETSASLDFHKLHFPLTLRKWQHGDAFYPLGMKKKKKLSDFFIDQKMSQEDKERTWLLCSGKHIAWIIGHRIDNRYRITSSTTEILRIIP